MIHAPSPPEFDEVLAQFPQLARARELYMKLLEDTSALRSLGYTPKQITYAAPALRLLAESGRVLDASSDDPSLNFPAMDGSRDVLDVYHLPDRKGFDLQAMRIKGFSPGDIRNILFDLLSPPSVICFEDFRDEVAHMALFDSKVDLTDVPYLVGQLLAHLTTAKLGIREEGLLSRAAQALGLAATYKAAWVDEATKLELVIKLSTPEGASLGPDYLAYRRLPPLSDPQGSMVPFGKRPNINQGTVEKIFAQQKEVFEGGLELVSE